MIDNLEKLFRVTDTNGGHLYFLALLFFFCVGICFLSLAFGEKAKLVYDLGYTSAASFLGALVYAMKSGNKEEVK